MKWTLKLAVMALGLLLHTASADAWCRTFRVAAGAVNVHRIVLEGGFPVEVVVDGDGDTDLDLYIYDENGSLIESDDDGLDLCLASWSPAWTGPFTIRVVNRGGVYNDYTLCVNQ